MRQKTQGLWSSLIAIVAAVGMSTFWVSHNANAAPSAPPTSPATTSSDTVDMGNGLTAYFAMPTEESNIKENALAAIKKWRQDALNDPNVTWGKPAKPLKEYLKSKSISKENYLNVKWSHDLNVISQIRATESVLHKKVAHERLNGEHPLSSIHVNNHSAYEEDIAWGNPNVTEAINNWASEKHDYVAKTGNETGHYESLIDPDNKSYAVSGIAAGLYGSTYVAEVSYAALDNESYAERPSLVGVKVPLSAVDLSKLSTGVKDVVEGKSYDLTLPKAATTTYGREAFIGGTWKSLSTEHATVASTTGSDVQVTGVKHGDLRLQFTPDISPSSDSASHAQTYSAHVTQAVITSVDNPADITVASGTQPQLPPTVTAHWNNDKTTQESVTWQPASDPNYYKARKGGVTTLSGTVSGVENHVHVNVRVTPATVVSVSPKNSTVTTESGTAPALPKTASVTWSNQETTNEVIHWGPVSKDQYSSRQGGRFTVEGTVENTDQTVHAVVEVHPATITSVENPAETVTLVNHKPQLPATLKATWSNGDVTSETVVWDEIQASQYDHKGSFTVHGTVGSQSVEAQVKVVEAVITSVEPLQSLTVESGTAPALPEAVVVNMSDGTQKKQAVTWAPAQDPNYYKARKGADVTLEGTVAGWDKSVLLTVHVNAAKAVKAQLESVSAQVESGDKSAKLPETAQVTWSNGDVTSEAVVWSEEVQADFAKTLLSIDDVESASFIGNVEGLEVQFALTIHHATVDSVDPVLVETEVKVAPKLPETVTVHWSNGLETQEKVKWAKADAKQYAAEGEFELEGAMVDRSWSDPVMAKVKVVAAAKHDDSAKHETKPVVPAKKANNPVTKSAKKDGKVTANKNKLAETGADVTLIAVTAMLTLTAAGAVLSARRRLR